MPRKTLCKIQSGRTGVVHAVTSVSEGDGRGESYHTSCGSHLLSYHQFRGRRAVYKRTANRLTCKICGPAQEGKASPFFRISMETLRYRRELAEREYVKVWIGNRTLCPHRGPGNMQVDISCTHPTREFFMDDSRRCVYRKCPYIGIQI